MVIAVRRPAGAALTLVARAKAGGATEAWAEGGGAEEVV